MIELDGVLVGISYCDCRPTIGMPVKLRHESDNPVDKYAIAAYNKGKKVGYIPITNDYVRSRIINGSMAFARVKDVGKVAKIHIYMLNKKESKAVELRYLKLQSQALSQLELFDSNLLK